LSASEPKYGEWPKEALIGLVDLELLTAGAMRPFQQQQLAMKIAKRTGASYPWLLQQIEDGPNQFSPRTA
jgi:hypothetical protein